MASGIALLHLLITLALVHISTVSCYTLAESKAASGGSETSTDQESSEGADLWRTQLRNLLSSMKEEDFQDFLEEREAARQSYPVSSAEYPSAENENAASSLSKEELISKIKRFSEFLGGKRKRSNSTPVNKRFSEFLGGKRKRYSEFLGGKKRSQEFISGDMESVSGFDRLRRFSEFLGGKRSVSALHQSGIEERESLRQEERPYLNNVRV